MALVKFYEKLLGSIGLTVDRKGKILLGEEPLLVNKIPLYLYKVGVNDDIILDGKGIPFNILAENVLDGVSKPLQKVIDVYEMQANIMLKSMVSVLLERLFSEYEFPASVVFKLQDLYKELEEVTSRSKTGIDELTLENYIKSIMKNIDLEVINVKERHGVEFEGEKFSSGVVAHYPVLRDLEDALKNDIKLGNSKMRKKDLRTYNAIFTYISNELGKIYGVSNIDDISDTTAFMKAIIHMNKFISDNNDIVYESDVFFNEFKNTITVKDISIAQKLRKEAELMPTVMVVDNEVEVVETMDTKKTTDDGDYMSAKELLRLKESKYSNQPEPRTRRKRRISIDEDFIDDEYYAPKRKRRSRTVYDDLDRLDEYIEDEYSDDSYDDFFEPMPRRRRRTTKRGKSIPFEDYEYDVPW